MPTNPRYVKYSWPSQNSIHDHVFTFKHQKFHSYGWHIFAVNVFVLSYGENESGFAAASNLNFLLHKSTNTYQIYSDSLSAFKLKSLLSKI